MANFQELSDELDAIKSGVDAGRTETAALKDEIAALKAQSGVITQEQLDSLDAKADSILVALAPAP